MAIDVTQDSSGISVNNVPGAVSANVVGGDGGGALNSLSLFYASVPKDTIDITTFTGVTENFKFAGAVQAPNGKIYFIPSSVSYVLIFDLLAGTIDKTTLAGIPGAGNKFAGAVLAKNNKIYCIPRDNDYVGIIDTENDTFDSTTITGLAGSDKWSGGTLSGNDKIYCAPDDSTVVLIIDTLTDTADTTTITGIAGNDKYLGNARASNGKIYCVPGNAANILVIDPSTDTVTTIAVLAGSLKWFGVCYSPVNDKLYCAPLSSTSVLIIDPVTDTADTATISGLAGVTKWGPINFSANGKIYCGIHGANTSLIIDPATDTVDSTSISVPFVAGVKTRGIIGDAVTGNIVLVPNNVEYIGIIKTGTPKYSIDFSFSAYGNKY